MESDQKKKKPAKVINLGVNKYKILYPLGKGSQGRVFCVENQATTKQYFAMKVCKPSKETANQIQVHKNCNCQNIVSIVQANKVEDRIFIILELGECNLEKYIDGKHNKRLDQEELFRLIRDVGNGLSVIHNNNFIHHDIKSSNIIVNFDMFKIADFGVSMKGQMKTFRGTPNYMAPQCLQMKTRLGACDSAMDIWALGVVVFQSCFDMHPIYTKSSTDLDYFKKQIEMLTKNGYSFAAFKNSLIKDQNTRKLKKFQDVQKQLVNKQLLEHFFSRTFMYQPTQRLKLQQIGMIIKQAKLPGAVMSFGSTTSIGSQNVIPSFNSQPVLSSSFDLQNIYKPPVLQRFPSFGSNQSLQSPLKQTLNTSLTGNSTIVQKTVLIEFMANTIQIMKMTLNQYPSQLNIGINAITSAIQAYQSNIIIDPVIIQATLLSIYNRLISLSSSIPGVFFRILIITYLPQILQNYQAFMVSMQMLSNGQINKGQFRQLQQYGAKIDAVRLTNVQQIVQHLK